MFSETANQFSFTLAAPGKSSHAKSTPLSSKEGKGVFAREGEFHGVARGGAVALPGLPAMRLLRSATCLLLALVGLATTGCKTTQIPETNRAAAVLIKNQSADAIDAATKAVFARHAYKPAKAEGEELVFQKPGTAMNAFVYGDWLSGGPIWERIRVYQRPLEPAEVVLEADLYMVQEPEDPFFQKERKLKGHRSKLQELLGEIAKRLEPGKSKSP